MEKTYSASDVIYFLQNDVDYHEFRSVTTSRIETWLIERYNYNDLYERDFTDIELKQIRQDAYNDGYRF